MTQPRVQLCLCHWKHGRRNAHPVTERLAMWARPACTTVSGKAMQLRQCARSAPCSRAAGCEGVAGHSLQQLGVREGGELPQGRAALIHILFLALHSGVPSAVYLDSSARADCLVCGLQQPGTPWLLQGKGSALHLPSALDWSWLMHDGDAHCDSCSTCQAPVQQAKEALKPRSSMGAGEGGGDGGGWHALRTKGKGLPTAGRPTRELMGRSSCTMAEGSMVTM